MDSAKRLLRNALELSIDQRAELALRLVESLDRDLEKNSEDAWAAEIGRRVQALRQGRLDSRPASEVFEVARARLTQPK